MTSSCGIACPRTRRSTSWPRRAPTRARRHPAGESLFVLVLAPSQPEDRAQWVDWSVEGPRVEQQTLDRMENDTRHDRPARAYRDQPARDAGGFSRAVRQQAWGGVRVSRTISCRSATSDRTTGTPLLKNLYFVGQSTHPGCGLPMVLISAECVADRIREEVAAAMTACLQRSYRRAEQRHGRLGEELSLRQSLPAGARRNAPSSLSTTTAGTRTTSSMNEGTGRLPCAAGPRRARASTSRPCMPAPPASSQRWLALADTLQRYPVPLEPLLELLDGVAMDLEPVEMQDFAMLHQYCRYVAGGVGLMLGPVLGAAPVSFREAGVRLGIAMQLTNVLRDVGEDLDQWPGLPACRRTGGIRVVACRTRRAPGHASIPPVHAVAGGSARAATSRMAAGWCPSSPAMGAASPCACCSEPMPASSMPSSGSATTSSGPARLRIDSAQAHGAGPRDVVRAAVDDVPAVRAIRCESRARGNRRRTRRPGRSRSGRLRAISADCSAATLRRCAGPRSTQPARLGSVGAGAVRIESHQLVGRVLLLPPDGENRDSPSTSSWMRPTSSVIPRSGGSGRCRCDATAAWAPGRTCTTPIACCGPGSSLWIYPQGQRRPAAENAVRLERGAAQLAIRHLGPAPHLPGRVPLPLHERAAAGGVRAGRHVVAARWRTTTEGS